MRARVTDYKEALDHLPTGATLVFEDVTRDEYEQLVNELEAEFIGLANTQGLKKAVSAFRQWLKAKA